MNKKLITLFFCLLFSFKGFQGFSQPYKRICVIGSSTAWGYFRDPNPPHNPLYPRDSAWTFKLSAYYKSLGQIDTLFNIASIGTDPYTGMPSSYTPPSGRNLPDGRYNITMAVNLIPKPDVIIVNYPSNNFDWQTDQEILFCLQTIKDSANAKGIQCYITTTQPRNTFSTSERQKLQGLKDIILNRFGSYAIDFFTPIVQQPSLNILPIYSLGDGIHTNPAGQTVLEQQVIAKNILLNTLAINFIDVNGAKESGKATLRWTIAADQELNHFVIERSANAKDFYEIGKVNPINSSGIQKYMFIDEQPSKSINYYRIVALESGNQKIFSKIIVLISAGKEFQVGKVFPIPAKDEININVVSGGTQKITFSIVDIDGRILKKETKLGQPQFLYTTSIAALPKGQYTLIIHANSQEESLQFIK